MPALRKTGPYIYPTWLPKLLAGLDSCEWKIWFQVHHDGKSWDKLPSDFNLTRYNLEHTELVRFCTEEYEQRGFTVTVEAQKQFELFLENGTISGKSDIVAWRDDEAVIVDAKAAKPNPSQEILNNLLFTAQYTALRPVRPLSRTREGVRVLAASPLGNNADRWIRQAGSSNCR